jgi:large subunit ribosomal protein L2
MAIKTYKPTTSTLRAKVSITGIITSGSIREPKSLLSSIKSAAGRNSSGKITSRHRGGRGTRKYRLIDFYRNKANIPAIVEAILYDPFRSANIALILYKDGERAYILAPLGLNVGMTIMSGDKSDIKPGNALKIKFIPIGTLLHSVELVPSGGARIARAAGSFVQLMSKDISNALLRLPSGELRTVPLDSMACVGQVGNIENELRKLGKAGISRHLGKRPHVRGVAMNPVDHPLGGGEGKSSGGRHPCSPWGWLTKGKKTRNNKRTDFQIVKRRK